MLSKKVLIFVREKGKLYLNTNGAFHTFEQLLVKEILFHGPWRTLWSRGARYYLSLLLRNYLCFLFNSLREVLTFKHALINPY